jgi:hypothetical protein
MKKKFLLRISPELWDDLNRWASDEMRSVNAQIEFLLQQTVRERRKNRMGEAEEKRSGGRSERSLDDGG